MKVPVKCPNCDMVTRITPIFPQFGMLCPTCGAEFGVVLVQVWKVSEIIPMPKGNPEVRDD